MHNVGQRVGGALQAQDAACVFVDEQKLIAQRSEALADSGDGTVVRGEMRSRESRRHAKGRPDLQGERGRLEEWRTLLARGVSQLVAAQRAHVQTYIAQHSEGTVESITRIALCEQCDHVHVPFVAYGSL